MRNFYKFTFIALFSLCAKAQVPTATIVTPSFYYCTDSQLFFAASFTNAHSSYTWTLPANRGASILTGVNDTSMVCTFSVPGIYTCSLTVANGTLSSTATKTITLTRSAIAAFNASLTSAGFPNELSLTNYSSYSTKNYWLYSGGLAKDSGDYILKPLSASGDYTVMLVALGKNGCNDSLSYAFRISDSSGVTLPNIFSPNNDGVNDIYRPVARGISSLKAWVYNRYGVIIASWERVNGFWDGTTTSGLDCRAGDYFIIVEASGFDGRSYKLKSTITLVK